MIIIHVINILAIISINLHKGVGQCNFLGRFEISTNKITGNNARLGINYTIRWREEPTLSWSRG